MTFELPELQYKYDALEPYIDAQTMEIHHSKHHKAYTDNFNKALEAHPELSEKEAEWLIVNLDQIPEDIRMKVRNHGGGYVNHNFFWQILGKDIKCSGKILEEINKNFGSFDEFKKKFSEAAMGRFGSGWAWLVFNEGKLEIMATPNQDSPLTEGKIPLLVIDIWEHAYYLKYQNKRSEWVENFFRVIDWNKVNDILDWTKEVGASA